MSTLGPTKPAPGPPDKVPHHLNLELRVKGKTLILCLCVRQKVILFDWKLHLGCPALEHCRMRVSVTREVLGLSLTEPPP